MPSFLGDLRRLRATFNGQNGDAQPDPSSSGAHSDGSYAGSNIANGSTGAGGEAAGPPPVPIRPSPSTHRYSIASGNSHSTTLSSTPPRQQQPTSPYAPRVVSVSDNSWVHQKILLIYGQIADPAQQQFDGTVWVCHHADSFPATTWPVCDAHFKALVHLQPGPNRLRLDFASPKVPTNGAPAHSSWLTVNYLPLNQSPPLELVVLLARDSPGTFDAPPERRRREGNDLALAIRKFKMTAYLWQAFTGEHMNRAGFGRRCFRLDEEYGPGSLSSRDAESGAMRNEARVHVVRTDRTLAELRDAERAQQNPKASRAGELFDIAGQAVRRHFGIKPGQTRYVSVLLLDTQWDPKAKLVRAHAALGGGGDGLQLAIFGSHALHSYPACVEDVVPAFSDCTRTDTAAVANDLDESGSSWEAANIGIGAHMHETGHLFGCPHQESGVMLRDYVTLNRTFTCREPYSTRTGRPGQRLVLPADECAWHRLDLLRFRFHPCFRLPSDSAAGPGQDDGVQVWSIDGGLLVTAASGLAFVELFAAGDDVCRAWIDFTDGLQGAGAGGGSSSSGRGGPLTQTTLTEPDLRARLPKDRQKTPRLKLDIFSVGQGRHTVEDVAELASKASRVRLANGQSAYRSGKLGFSQMDGSRPQEMLLWTADDSRKLMTSVRVYAGYALDGVEFVYEDATTQLFGQRGGTASDFALDPRRGEVVLGFYMRAGLWIDGLQVITSLGRRSPVYGNAGGGSGHTLIPPRGYRLAGISGSCAQWIDGFQLLVTR